jgi:hypothetical protein
MPIRCISSSPVLLEVPVSVVEWAHLACLQPATCISNTVANELMSGHSLRHRCQPMFIALTDAVEMKCMIAHSPRHCTLVRRSRAVIRLTLDAQIPTVCERQNIDDD